MRVRRALVGSLALALATAGAASTTATARPVDDKPHTLAKGLVSPLSLAVSRDGTVYYSENFAGMLHSVAPDGATSVVYRAPKKGTEVGAVSEKLGSLRFATTKGAKAMLWGVGGSGRAVKLADLGAYEERKNPDADVTYGIANLDPACAAQFPEMIPSSYPGIVESHPYATLIDGGRTYVADAAANAVLSVNRKGKVSTVAVLPSVPVVLTAETVAAAGLPACATGQTYAFEPVPTDVEKGPGNWLYVSTLPGGPEDGSTGALGAVHKVNVKTGAVKLVADGLVSVTGLAVSPKGDVYAAQLFTGGIARIKKGSGPAKPFAQTMMPGDLEWGPAGLYGTIGVLKGLEPGSKPGGKLVHWR